MLRRLLLWLNLALGAFGVAACSQEAEVEPVIGYVEADWRYVSAPESGWIVDQSVREGGVVQMGDTLFTLDTTAQEAALSEAEARIRQAAAQARNLETGARQTEIDALDARLEEALARLELATADRDRFLPLVESGLASKAQGDRVTTEYNRAKAAVEALEKDIAVAKQAGRPAALEAAKAATQSVEAARNSAAYRLSQRTVHAGVSGRVEDIFLHMGEFVTPGAPVLAIAPDTGLKAKFFVPQDKLMSLEVGREVMVLADGAPVNFSAQVSFIASEPEFTPPVIYSADVRDKLVFMVEASLPPDTRLHPGLPIEVTW